MFHTMVCVVLLQEVFKSDFHSVAPFSQVVGKVCVLFIREYLKFFPEVREEEGGEARGEIHL